jgi:hypothetical protein
LPTNGNDDVVQEALSKRVVVVAMADAQVVVVGSFDEAARFDPSFTEYGQQAIADNFVAIKYSRSMLR